MTLTKGPGRLLPSDLSPVLQCGSGPSSDFLAKITYVWYAAKLITSREGFCNVNQVAFQVEEKTAKWECSKQALLRCSLCRKFLCFRCIYDEYHPESCKPVIPV
jgi:hypothetical protein